MRYHTTYKHRYCPICNGYMTHYISTYECNSCGFKERSEPRKLIPISQYGKEEIPTTH